MLTRTSLLLCFAVLVLANVSFGAPLLITGVFDGPLDGGEPKVVELFACEDIPNLALYAAGAANNGGGTDGPESILPAGPVSAGTFIYIVDDNSDSATGVEFNQYFGFTPTILVDSNLGTNGGAAAINGDDAVELFFDPTGLFTGGQTVVDTFGEITHATPGTAATWSYQDGWAYRISFTGPDGGTFVEPNWIYSGDDATDGQLTNDQVPGSRFPIGSYTCIPEPSTVALVLFGLCVVGLGRRTVR
jgi:hypothetical protein